MSSSHYSFPAIYQALLAPETEELEQLDRWLSRYHTGPLNALCDPACGPATYLLPMARRGLHVAGNELDPKAADFASELLKASDFHAEIACGNMRSFQLQTGPFDVALNLHSSVGHLPSDAALLEHLQVLHQHLRSQGLALLGVTLLPPDVLDDTLQELYTTGWREVSGGWAWIRYESLERNGRDASEHIRVTMKSTDIPNVPNELVEHYVLRTFTMSRLNPLLARAGFELLGVESCALDMLEPLQNPREGEVVLALRTRSLSPS